MYVCCMIAYYSYVAYSVDISSSGSGNNSGMRNYGLWFLIALQLAAVVVLLVVVVKVGSV